MTMNCMMLIKTAATATIAVPIRVPIVVSDEDSFCPSAKCKKIVLFQEFILTKGISTISIVSLLFMSLLWCPLLLPMLNNYYHY